MDLDELLNSISWEERARADNGQPIAGRFRPSDKYDEPGDVGELFNDSCS